jgi:hypothetical protein
MHDHPFVRHPDPRFGSAFGGGCAEKEDGVTCGWPELAHPNISAVRARLAADQGVMDSETSATPGGEPHV